MEHEVRGTDQIGKFSHFLLSPYDPNVHKPNLLSWSFSCTVCLQCSAAAVLFLFHLKTGYGVWSLTFSFISFCSHHDYCEPAYLCEVHSSFKRTYTHTHTHSFNGLFPEQPELASTKGINHSGFYWSKRWSGDSGISWTIMQIICTSSIASHARRPATHSPRTVY